jgi:porin
VEPIRHLRFAVGVYNADEETVDPERNGTRFALNPGDGLFAIGEVSYAWNQPEEETEGGAPEATHGLPGLAKVGVFGETGSRESLADGSVKNGNVGFYLSLQQMVYREPGSVDQGLTPWVVGTFLPRESINEVPTFFGAGLVYKGLIPTRDEDHTAIGFFQGELSSDLATNGSERVLEINHTVQLTPWLYVRPDLQLVFNPAGDRNAPTAIVFGGEVGITF